MAYQSLQYLGMKERIKTDQQEFEIIISLWMVTGKCDKRYIFSLIEEEKNVTRSNDSKLEVD